MKIETVTVVEILPTAVWVESDAMGSRSVMLQHQGHKLFRYATFFYDYCYTSNAGTFAAAESLARLLGAGEVVEHRRQPLFRYFDT